MRKLAAIVMAVFSLYSTASAESLRVPERMNLGSDAKCMKIGLEEALGAAIFDSKDGYSIRPFRCRPSEEREEEREDDCLDLVKEAGQYFLERCPAGKQLFAYKESIKEINFFHLEEAASTAWDLAYHVPKDLLLGAAGVRDMPDNLAVEKKGHQDHCPELGPRFYLEDGFELHPGLELVFPMDLETLTTYYDFTDKEAGLKFESERDCYFGAGAKGHLKAGDDEWEVEVGFEYEW